MIFLYPGFQTELSTRFYSMAWPERNKQMNGRKEINKQTVRAGQYHLQIKVKPLLVD